jgi:sphingomyelin phosphodiesterase 2
VTDIKAVFTELVPGQNYSFSDHFGLEATLEVGDAPSRPSTHCSELSDATATAVVQALSSCYRDARTRSRKELAICGVSLFAILAMIIGTAWLSHPWITPVFILITMFMSWLATTMLYEGFIYGNWERNALMNVIEDLEVYNKGREHSSP